MRHSRISLKILLLVVVITILFVLEVGRKYSWKDLFFYLDNQTLYSPRYSESAFSKIQIGMERSQVLETLGEPLEKVESRGICTVVTRVGGPIEYRMKSPTTAEQCDGAKTTVEWLNYTLQGNPTANYRIRSVIIRDDHVVDVLKTWEMD